MKRFRDIQPNSKEDPKLSKYISKLENYLSEQNIPLIDFTHDKSLTKKHFGKGDHLNREAGRSLFTKNLSKEIKSNLALLDSQVDSEKIADNTKNVITVSY